MGCDYFVEEDKVIIRIYDYDEAGYPDLGKLREIRIDTEEVEKMDIEIEGARRR